MPVAATGSNTFTRPANTGSFLADGVRKDMTITVNGFASKGNNGQFVVKDVSDSTVVVDSPIAVAGGPLTVETATSDSVLVAGQSMVGVFIIYRDPAGIPQRGLPGGHQPLGNDRGRRPGGMGVAQDSSRKTTWACIPTPRAVPVEVQPTGTLRPDQIDLILQRKEIDYLSSSARASWPTRLWM